MKRLPLCLALVLLLVVNALVLTGVVRNRAGTPEAELTLTERELVLSLNNDREENSGVALQLDWQQGEDWFDQAKIDALGLELPRARDDESYRRNHSLPQKVFVVLEYEGSAWLRLKEQKEQELAALREELRQGKVTKEDAENRQAQIEGDLYAASRLFAVDAGTDPGRLRGRYPDASRYLIVPGLARVNTDYQEDKRRLRGYIESILVDSLHVPRELHTTLLALPAEGRLSRGYRYNQPVLRPRYEVLVQWGRRWEPSVREVRLIGGE